MASEYSFDIVSEFDQQELVNALDQARRDVATRYDLKDTGSEITLDSDKSVTILTTDSYTLSSIVDILQAKITKRGISPMVLTRGKEDDAANNKIREVLPLKKGVDKELAKKIVSAIKEQQLKVQASIQGEQVRVSSKDKDSLQQVITYMRTLSDELQVPLQFTNYR